jgi:iron complex transport system substrate-binding protein
MGNGLSNNTPMTTITDALGNQTVLSKNASVISAYGSFAECWLLSGGTLIGVTQDAIDERHLDLSNDVAIIGTVKEPNLEQLISLAPDYVILSADLAAHLKLQDQLKQLGIKYGYFHMDTFDNYADMMKQFCAVNQRPDLFESNVTAVSNRIQFIKADIAKIQSTTKPRVLLIRAYASGMKAKGADNLAGIILQEYGCQNVVDQYSSLLEDLSIEEIIMQDPDYIFVLTMGEEDKALDYMQKNILSNPSWNSLSAVQNGHYYVLPKELFHYKPNRRWSESYEYLAKILFPEQFK